MNAVMYQCHYKPERDKKNYVVEPTARVDFMPAKETNHWDESIWLRFEDGSVTHSNELIVMMTRAQFLAYAAKVAAAVQSLEPPQEPR